MCVSLLLLDDWSWHFPLFAFIFPFFFLVDPAISGVGTPWNQSQKAKNGK
jgi:hypothetical protein